MYSVVMLMAMTAAPETPNCHWLSNGCGCGGSSWSGRGSWGSCYGQSSGGCYGSSYSSGWGCYGSGYGGGYMPYNCGGYGIYGGTNYSWPTPYTGGCGGCYGYGYPAPPPVWNAPRDEKMKEKEIKPKSTFAPLSPNQAQVIVSLPADAKLFANGQLTALTSSERSFVSPTLDSSRDYQYDLKVEYVRDGKTISNSQIVKVRGGEVSRVEFAETSTLATSWVKIVMPRGAKLFVNDLPRELPNGTTEFKTPLLTKGGEYAYTFRAETIDDGKKREHSRRIVFKAGDAVTVDFSEMNVNSTVSK